MTAVLATWALAFAAFAGLAASMERHRDVLLRRADGPRASLAWRAGGFALLALSLLPCVARWGASVGATAWLGTLTLAAMALGLLFTYAPGRLRWAVPAAAAGGAALWLLAAY